MVDYNIILVIIVIIIIIIINTVNKIQENPLSIFKSTYNEINIKINKQEIYRRKKKGSLIILSHSYEHIDLIILYHELLKTDPSCVLFGANRPWNWLLHSLFKSSFNKCKVIYITKNTVNKMKLEIEQGYNVIVFYYQYKKDTGIYNLIKMTDCDIYTARITCNNPHIKSMKNNNIKSLYKMVSDSFNNQYHIEYNTFDKPTDNELPADYITRFKTHIYGI